MSCSGPHRVIDAGNSSVWMNVPVFLRQPCQATPWAAAPERGRRTLPSGDPWGTIPRVRVGGRFRRLVSTAPRIAPLGRELRQPIQMRQRLGVAAIEDVSAITFARRLASPLRVMDVGLAVLRFPLGVSTGWIA